MKRKLRYHRQCKQSNSNSFYCVGCQNRYLDDIPSTQKKRTLCANCEWFAKQKKCGLNVETSSVANECLDSLSEQQSTLPESKPITLKVEDTVLKTHFKMFTFPHIRFSRRKNLPSVPTHRVNAEEIEIWSDDHGAKTSEEKPTSTTTKTTSRSHHEEKTTSSLGKSYKFCVCHACRFAGVKKKFDYPCSHDICEFCFDMAQIHGESECPACSKVKLQLR